MDLYNPDVLADVFSYISELSLDGIDTLQSRALNKDNALSDEELALALFAEEAEGLLNIAKERAGHALARTAAIFDELEEMEAAARYDHLVALAIAEGRDIPPRPVFTSRGSVVEPDSDDESSAGSSSASSSASSSSASDTGSGRDAQPSPISLRSFLTLMSTGRLPRDSARDAQVQVGDEDDDSEEDEGPIISMRGPPSPAIESIPPQQCIICGDDIDGPVYEAPCGDVFDIDCLETMFRKATLDESLYPPRCCVTEIPMSAARQHLSSNLIVVFNKKAREFNTLSRVYCHSPRCSAFIGPAVDEAIMLECPECEASTCGLCKAKAHPGKKCSDTDDLNNMAQDMNKQDGWQRCPDCRHMVELSVGCYHITCVCKAQFCYLCGERWKTCSCPQFAIPADLE